jgi:dihydrofolate synthase/folylpolyglutamate synthase
MRRSNPHAQVEIAATVEQAFSSSRAIAASPGRRIYAAGGLFTAIEFAAVGRGQDPKQLAFF